MNPMREKQKAEALVRLKLMHIRENVHKMFEEEDRVMLCEAGSFRPLSESEKEEVHQFEQEHNSTVYLAVRMNTVFGTLDALLFVGKYDEEWEIEREDLRDGYALSYTINREYPECSEMGSICFRITKDGCVVREG